MRQSDHQEVTVPMMYTSSVRRQVCLRLRGGESVAEIAADTGISPATLFRWKAQALIDAGVNEGGPASRPTSSPRCIARLGAELASTESVRVVQRLGSVLSTRKVAIFRGLNARCFSNRSARRITGLNRSTYQFHCRLTMPTREVRRLVVADAIEEIPSPLPVRRIRSHLRLSGGHAQVLAAAALRHPQALVGQQPLERGILPLQVLQPLRIVSFQAAELVAPPASSQMTNHPKV